MYSYDVNLINYLIPKLKAIKEYIEITKSEDVELNNLLIALDTTLDNMFIQTADEAGISRFEKLMGIKPATGEALDDRRFNVATKWVDEIPYSEAVLNNTLTLLCGEEGYRLVKDYAQYKIDILINLGKSDQFDAVVNKLSDMMPCNLIYNVMLMYNTHQILSQFTHTQLSGYTHKQLREVIL